MDLTPKNDVIFKMIFTDHEHPMVLVHFLNSVIKPKSLIKNIEVKGTELTPEYVEKKGVRLDIIAMTDTNEIINIEMQKKDEKDMAARSLFYWSKLFAAQLIVGEEFNKLKRTISINILDFAMFKDDERYWRKGYLKDDVSNEKFTDLLEVHFIELNKVQLSDQSPLAFWAEFFRDPYSEKMNMVYEKVPEMKEAKEIFERAKLDPEAQEIMRVYEKAAYDYGNDISVAKAEGLVEGRAEGLAEGEVVGLEKGKHEKAKETAARMLSKGMLIEDVSDITGLSLKEVQRLKNEK